MVFLPSTEDIGHIYPIPQPMYPYCNDIEGNAVRFVSNPGQIILHGGREKVEINVINSDLLQYIDEYKTGRAGGDVLMDNLESYFRQPFLVSNTI